MKKITTKIYDLFKKKSGDLVSAFSFSEIFKMEGRAKWFGHSYWNFAIEGYAKNIIAYWCIKTISEAVADIPFRIMENGKEISDAKLIALLKRPNPIEGWKTFMQNLIMHRLISGNCYIHANIVSTGRIMEMQWLRPDRVTIMYTAYYQPYEFMYTYYGKVYHFPIDLITQHSEVLHIKEPNPLQDLYGMSPMAPGSMGIDQHNEAGEWNKKLLENSARPPGILSIRDKSDNAATLSAEQLEKLREQLEEKITGSKNAGRIPILNFDMIWQSLGMSPTDMDWLSGKDTSAREICYAFGVPPHLLGLPDSSTYNNMAEATLALYEKTVIPLYRRMLEEISNFINYHQGTNIEIVPNLDHISALQPRRELARTTARADFMAGLLTLNEAREEIGYEPVPGGDENLVPAGRLPISFDPSEDMPATDPAEDKDPPKKPKKFYLA